MREVRVRWKKASLLSTDLGKLIYGICDSFEVAAHLEQTSEGMSTISEIHFRKGKGIEDFRDNPFFRFDGPRESLDENKYLVRLSHHLLGFSNGELAVLTPYVFNEDGVTMLIRGTVEGVREFLTAVRISFREPDTLSTLTNGIPNTEKVLTERQLEIVRSAVTHGYYSKPREINLRQLADVLCMARSTLGEHLHRAESTMMKWAASDEF